ncbi:MAG TPA: hypothetical protein VIY49_12175 [Bryobacteraceae bacterium]
MRSIHFAEWILGLVTSPDRAASTVGDLVEGAADRGVVWFWTGILRTAASLLWCGVAGNPVRVTGVALIGLAVDVVASLLLAGLTGVVFFLAAWYGHRVPLNSVWWVIALDVPELLVSVLIGRILARWAPGRELSACLAYGILGSIFSIIMIFVSTGGLGPSALLWVFLSDVTKRIPVLAGAVWGRHRGLAAR